MFSTKDEKAKPAKPVTTNNSGRSAPSLLSADLEITGNVKTDGEMQVDGRVEGDIECKKLMIGEGASINGEITADAIVVRGQVNGLIKAATVELARSSRVIGDVWHDTLAIEAGAYIEGHCRRNDTAKPGRQPAASKPAATAETGTAAGDGPASQGGNLSSAGNS
jgi:cytoskeletal protein CcmA (bactofilin family)